MALKLLLLFLQIMTDMMIVSDSKIPTARIAATVPMTSGCEAPLCDSTGIVDSSVFGSLYVKSSPGRDNGSSVGRDIICSELVDSLFGSGVRMLVVGSSVCGSAVVVEPSVTIAVERGGVIGHGGGVGNIWGQSDVPTTKYKLNIMTWG